MIHDAIKFFLNLCGKSFTENKIKHYWNYMITWIEEMKNNKIMDTLYKIAMEVVESTKIKKGCFFNYYFKECVLDLEDKTTGRTEEENKILKVFDVDQRTSLTKLV